mmetsp:Transcript_15763/g.34270  ORF Transcript_15763/g.34270 Transcript_15763/m.34270 type:complete len:221 (+) Transcript_15763:531-1193(+)
MHVCVWPVVSHMLNHCDVVLVWSGTTVPGFQVTAPEVQGHPGALRLKEDGRQVDVLSQLVHEVQREEGVDLSIFRVEPILGPRHEDDLSWLDGVQCLLQCFGILDSLVEGHIRDEERLRSPTSEHFIGEGAEVVTVFCHDVSHRHETSEIESESASNRQPIQCVFHPVPCTITVLLHEDPGGFRRVVVADRQRAKLWMRHQLCTAWQAALQEVSPTFSWL